MLCLINLTLDAHHQHMTHYHKVYKKGELAELQDVCLRASHGAAPALAVPLPSSSAAPTLAVPLPIRLIDL